MADQDKHSGATDLVSLLEHVPILLNACLCGYNTIPDLRNMRLVSKEAGRVALLALTSYTLKLEGDAKDTNISGVRLLQHTRLKHLSVHLHLSGRPSVTVLNQGRLKRFESPFPFSFPDHSV